MNFVLATHIFRFTLKTFVGLMLLYLHFRSNLLMNRWIFATVHSLMNYTNLIDRCQAHLSVQYASNIKLIR